jgi:hypothetical protein
MSENAEGSGISVLAGKEMLIDTEYPGTRVAPPLGPLALQEVVEPALDGGRANLFPPPEAAAVDTVIVRDKDTPAKWLGGPFA